MCGVPLGTTNTNFQQINMWFVYLIQSKLDSSFYIGFAEHLRKRIIEHNQDKTKSIKHKVPFRLIYFEAYPNKTLARKREIELKKNSFKKKELLERLGFSARGSCLPAGRDHHLDDILVTGVLGQRLTTPLGGIPRGGTNNF